MIPYFLLREKEKKKVRKKRQKKELGKSKYKETILKPEEIKNLGLEPQLSMRLNLIENLSVNI